MQEMKNVVVYSKDWCMYCRAAKGLLTRMQIPFEEIDVTHDPGGFDEMVRLADGRDTVPQIFIDGKGIGGFTELHAMVMENRTA